ncbi:DUF3500 domain-containing protein [Spirosoma luteolum]
MRTITSRVILIMSLWLILISVVSGQARRPAAPTRIRNEVRERVDAFIRLLTPAQRQQALFGFNDEERFDWHYVPRARKGLPLRAMTPPQREAAMALLKSSLSQEGYERAVGIMDLENVLRVIEKRPATDTYRDPGQYAFSIFGDPAGAAPWSWRVDGHHLSLHFLLVTTSDGGGQVLAQTPTFFGSNPAEVRVDVPQKSKQILREETEQAFALLASLDAPRRSKAVLDAVAYPDIVTGNRRQISLEQQDGLRLGDMTDAQRRLFMTLLRTYLNRYPITLANQQLAKLTKTGLDELRFAWAGDLTPELGAGKGWYYRIHGPTILIEYDNTQNQANHIHTVVRDLTNDFGFDALQQHYQSTAHGKP